MNIRSLTLVLGITGALALVACKSESGTGIIGGGGSGGSVGGGGSGGSACANTCPEALTAGSICPGGTGEAAFDSLISCASGACAAECADLVMGTGGSDAACGSCLQASCGTEFTDCSNAF